MTNMAGGTALVFAGGGSLGAVQVGMLHELVATGLTFDLVVGASVGALNAAYFARDPCLKTVEGLEALWRKVKRTDILPLNLATLWRIAFNSDSLTDGQALRRLIVSHLGQMQFSDAALPLHIVATDQSTGDEVILKDGAVEDALMASAAIPGIFPPVLRGDKTLVDGGVANNTPISTAISLGAKRIYILPTGYNCASTTQRRGLADHAMNALNLLIARQMKADIDRYRDKVELLVAPALCPLEVSALDYSQSATLIDRARRLTRSWLETGGHEICEGPSVTGHHLHD